jgi:flap endonuclease-1
MGIKNLNRYLLNTCTEQSIRTKHLKIFQGKTVVIDTSIYLYKFLENNELIENMYLMISIFLYYKITPIFIFDGKPPKEKKEVLQKRKQSKKDAEEKYNSLVVQNQQNNPDIEFELNKLKKQFVRIKYEDIDAVKKLMTAYGVQYLEAEGEADKLCAKMVIENTAWACVSDDTDMFVYGCTRVMRHMDINKHTVVYYNLDNILRELQLPLQEFREIMILSGTDYNINNKITLYKALKMHKEYKHEQSKGGFYEWLSGKNIPNSQQLYEVYAMFVDYGDTTIPYKPIVNSRCNFVKLQRFLEPYGFVFL